MSVPVSAERTRRHGVRREAAVANGGQRRTMRIARKRISTYFDYSLKMNTNSKISKCWDVHEQKKK
jgi:hypothetical protein